MVSLFRTMAKYWFIYVIIILINSILIKAAADFGEPPFLQGPKDERIQFGKYTDKIKTQEISFDEEIAEEITIAYINYDQKSPKPELDGFSLGTNALLGAAVEFNEKQKKWALIIKNKQDYETPSMQEYMFSIHIDNADNKRYVHINVINIPDNYPILTANQNICEIEESEGGVGETKCTYNVRDIDQMLPDLKYTLTGDTADEFFEYKKKQINYENGELTLVVKKALNYDEYVNHILNLMATNKGDLSGSVAAVVKVKNVPLRIPKWQNIISSMTLEEKTEKTLTVLAKDGDVGINTEIHYKIKLDNEEEDFFEILDKTKGEIHIKAIDRDALNIDIFYFTIIAYKANNESSFCDQKILIMVEDINDNQPEITIPKAYQKPISILEETYEDFNETIIVEDIDSVKYATYDIELKDATGNVGWNKAFALKPIHGYQKTDLQLLIMNASLLDFDTPEWQKITLEIIATETVDEKHVDKKKIDIRLINLNDEEPIFESDGIFKVSLQEDIKKGKHVCTVKATDRDIGDKLIYSLSETAKRSFVIDKNTGKITTKLDKSLDHEQQTEVSIQVYVEDTFLDNVYNRTHKLQGEVIITVIDVNDKTPQITLDYDTEFVSIVENTPAGQEVQMKINGYDPDSDAKLEFLIDWETSRAVKQGRNVDLKLFKNCLKIEWEENSINEVIAKLIVQEVEPNITIDYEVYEMLYINVTLIDHMQTINKRWDSVTIPLYILDVNDCEPIFDVKITDQLKYVRDKADKDTIIGTVLATDADGPDFNYVTYAIKPLDGIPDDLVKISKELGEIRVQNTIDCDDPNYWPSINYTVIATDCINREGEPVNPCFQTPYNINITINDVNDQKPKLNKFSEGEYVKIYENETHGYLINEIDASDKDRDAPYRFITYVIDSPPDAEINSIFKLVTDKDTDNGIFYVNCSNGQKRCLDRDHGDFIYSININMYDNQGGNGVFNQEPAIFTIELLDINDNPPIFDEPKNFQLTSVKENVEIGTLISKIHANDIDDPNLDNSKVVYGIAHAYKENDDSKKDYSNLFDIRTDDKFKSGSVYTKETLENHFGIFHLNLTAHDKGEPPLSSSQIFSLTVLKHNYKKPEITFPMEDLALKKPVNEEQNDLFYFNNGTLLPYFGADDGFHGAKWNITFEIIPEDVFTLHPVGVNQAKLSLIKLPTEASYTCTLTAKDNGDPVETSQKQFKIYFINDGQPQFDKPNSASTQFYEDTNGTLQKWIVEPEAVDPVPEGYKRTMYYFIIGGDQDRFKLDRKTRELSVNEDKPLDRKIPFHSVLIGVTTTDKEPSNLPKESTLNVTIEVLGINKYSPTFKRDTFKSGIHSNTPINSKILQLDADDEDLNYENVKEKLQYELDVESIKVSDPSLEDNKEITFSINKNTGEVQLKRTVQPSMTGFYTFNLQVVDAVGHSDTAEGYVYIITEANQVMFAFNNTIKEVEQHQLGVADTFTDAFANECNIDSITNDIDGSGGAITDRTRVFTHFIKDNTPIDGEIIKIEANDLETIYQLRAEFLRKYNLNFDYAFKDSNVNTKDMQQLLQTILIVVVAVLGTLCFILFAAFVVRTRSLNQRLEALSTTKFGSQDSNLNRIGAPLPNTNQFAVQGSNPVWNDDIKLPEYDVKSMGSGDSTLVGIEDSLTFANLDEISPEEQRRASFNPVMQQEMKRKSLNPMANQHLSLNDE